MSRRRVVTAAVLATIDLRQILPGRRTLDDLRRAIGRRRIGGGR